ncbi:electron transfer flavoprotein subunit beta/FixA family protein [Chloroflexota bacterium]
MNIIVCVKQILDPEIPVAGFKLDATSRRVVPPEGVPPVINPFDAQAVELALRLKAQHGGKITVLTVGDKDAGKVVKQALSMGADEGFILSDEAFKDSDCFATAYILARAIQKVGDCELILCGRQAADGDEGLTGSLIAHALGLPLVTLAKAIEVEEGKLLVTRVILDGYQQFIVSRPAVVTISNEVGSARLPTGRGIIFATRAQIPVWGRADIDADPFKLGAEVGGRRLLRLSIPVRERKCEIIPGESATEAASELVVRLRETGLI